MNPHDLLTSEHAALRHQVGVLQEAVDKDPKTLAEELVRFQQTVQKHFKREEVYYRILDDGKRLDDRGLVHQLRNDHAAVVFALESLSIRLRKNGLNTDWRTRLALLVSVFVPHLDQEDTLLFPLGQKILSPKELDTIAQQLETLE